jgi:GAF domain-containing protein/HAMP domain-containing protein
VLFPVLIGLVVLGAVLALFSRHLTDPLEDLQQAMQALGVGSFDPPVTAVARRDEIGDVARSFVDMRQQTQNLIEDLERRIARRTRDMETTQEISRFAVTQRDLQALMDDVVSLVVERFDNIYHAQIFLIDADRRFAVLRASTGSVGTELLSRGHRLAVGSISVIGQVTARGEVIVARDTASSEVHRQNEFLPETRAELAVPLQLGDEIIGALDLQSKASDTFDDEQINVLKSMANQLGIAIENTRLYQESLQRLRNIQEQSRAQTQQNWQEYMYDNRTTQLAQQAGTPTMQSFDELRQRAINTKRPIIGDETERQTIPIAVPLRLRGEVIGAIAWELPAKEYDNNKVQLAEDLAERLALSLDNTRLFEQSQRATERERLVNDISAKLTGQTDVNRILQTAVREVGQALRAPQVSIRLSRQDDTGIRPQPVADDDTSDHGN